MSIDWEDAQNAQSIQNFRMVVMGMFHGALLGFLLGFTFGAFFFASVESP